MLTPFFLYLGLVCFRAMISSTVSEISKTKLCLIPAGIDSNPYVDMHLPPVSTMQKIWHSTPFVPNARRYSLFASNIWCIGCRVRCKERPSCCYHKQNVSSLANLSCVPVVMSIDIAKSLPYRSMIRFVLNIATLRKKLIFVVWTNYYCRWDEIAFFFKSMRLQKKTAQSPYIPSTIPIYTQHNPHNRFDSIL